MIGNFDYITIGNETVVSGIVSKRGLVCLYEAGGGYTNTGEATVVCNRNYNRKKAVYVFTRGSLACENHAVIPVALGDHVIQVERHNDICKVCDYGVKGIYGDQVTLVLLRKSVLSIDYKGNKAVETAIEKSTIYHCRKAIYIRESN